jgi:RNase P/RNase MRP subunit p30
MIDTTNIEQAKKLIKTEKLKPLVVLAQNDEFNRKILEYGKFDILLSVERGNRQRTLRTIDSGLNHVLAEIATKNKISIGVDMDELRVLGKEEKANRLEKIKQNIKICRKAKTKLALLNYKDDKDAFAFLISLGSSTKQAKSAVQ